MLVTTKTVRKAEVEMRILKLLKWWHITFAVVFIAIGISGNVFFNCQCADNLMINTIAAAILIVPTSYKIVDKTRRSTICSTDVIKLVIILSNIVLNITYYIGVV